MKKNTQKTSGKSGSGLKLKPLGDKVLLMEIKDDIKQTDSGIYIPDTVKEDRGTKKGQVVAVGEGRLEDGKIIPIKVSVGDTVLFQWGDTVKYQDKEYTVVRESEIIAIIG